MQHTTKLTLLLCVNADWFFLSHRLPIALEAKRKGYEVHIATVDTGKRAEIESYGLVFHPLYMSRSGTNPIKEIGVLFQIWRLLGKIRPTVAHFVTLKPVVYGAVASRLRSIPALCAVSGLGYLFIHKKQSVVSFGFLKLLKWGLGTSHSGALFQNTDDEKDLRAEGILDRCATFLIKGSGVSLEEFPHSVVPSVGKKRVVLPARMLYDKGVQEFIDAANILKETWKGTAEFVLSGGVDPGNKASVPKEALEDAEQEGYVSWVGHQAGMLSMLQSAYLVVLPSYREGLPKSLIEAAAVGRPIVTTDVPGCKECVTHGYNGILVPPRNARALAHAIDEILSDNDLATRFGNNSRIFAETHFDIQYVVEKHLEIYRKLAK